MERIYDIAGVRFRILFDGLQIGTENALLENFRTYGGHDHTIKIEAVTALAEPQGKLLYRDVRQWVFGNGPLRIRYVGAMANEIDGAYLRIWRDGAKSLVQVKKDAMPLGLTSKILMIAMELEHQITRSGGAFLHAASILHQGKAILFTAPSGVGKSTQAALWCENRGAKLLNGDRAVVRGGVVCGVPLCGSSHVAENMTAPIEAIVYLTQAPENKLTRLTGAKAFQKIWEGCSLETWEREDMALGVEAVSRIVNTVPVYHLACTPDLRAVELLENELTL
ncbi:MAG: hypothetical protein IJV82_00580 [Oscillospiraceae bacterium]|nr:hypothetical protein [Oscillospiraceae bacterium]